MQEENLGWLNYDIYLQWTAYALKTIIYIAHINIVMLITNY